MKDRLKKPKLVQYAQRQIPRFNRRQRTVNLVRHFLFKNGYEFWEFYDDRGRRIFFYDIYGSEFCTMYHENGIKSFQAVYRKFTPLRISYYNEDGIIYDQYTPDEEWQFDSRGNITYYHRENGTDEDEDWRYDEFGREIYHHKAGFGTKRTVYDSEGCAIYYEDCSGRERSERLNISEREVVITDPRGHMGAVEKNEKGQIIHCRHLEGAESWYSYDYSGNMIYRKDSQGEFTLQYNGSGHLTSIKSIKGEKTLAINYEIGNPDWDTEMEYCDIIFDMDEQAIVDKKYDDRSRPSYMENYTGDRLWLQYDLNFYFNISGEEVLSKDLGMLKRELIEAFVNDNGGYYLLNNCEFELRSKDHCGTIEYYYADGSMKSICFNNLSDEEELGELISRYWEPECGKKRIEGKALEGIIKLLLFRGFFGIDPAGLSEDEYLFLKVGSCAHKISCRKGSKGEGILKEVREFLKERGQLQESAEYIRG
ncbi:MAG: hypothetical protein Q8930_01140 [Bacillota bacterium]|nr:hypothetical protein [Bacillota bacterium]